MSLSIAAKFVESSKPLPVDCLLIGEDAPKNRSLLSLAPDLFRPTVSDDGDGENRKKPHAVNEKSTHDERELEKDSFSELEDAIGKVKKPSLSLASVDRFAMMSLLKQPSIASSSKPDNVNAETKQVYNRFFFLSPPEGRTESDLQTFDEMLFSLTEACQPLTKSARFSIAQKATLRSIPAGTIVFRPGEQQACVFFVLSGSLDVEENGSVRTIRDGMSLGSFPEPPSYDPFTPRTRQPLHLSPLPLTQWTGTCRANTPTDLVLLTLSAWNAIVQADSFCFQRKVALFLEDLPVFSILSRAQIETLSKIARFQVFQPGSIVFRQGLEGEDVYIIKAGFVRVVRDCRMGDVDRNTINKAAKDSLSLENDIVMIATPRSKGKLHQLQSKLPPSFLDKIPPPPSPTSFSTKSCPVPSEDFRLAPSKRGAGLLSPSEKLKARIRDVEVRSMSGVGGLSTKRLGGGLTPRTTEQGEAAAEDEPDSSRVSLPPLDFSTISKASSAPPNQINNSTLFSPRSPRKLDRNPFVLVELGSLGSGQVFGDTRSCNLHFPPELKPKLSAVTGPLPNPVRPFSAVCDTRVELFQISKHDAMRWLGPDVEFLWLPDGAERSSAPQEDLQQKKKKSKIPASSASLAQPLTAKQTKADAKVKDELQRKIQWENYKKKVVKMVFEDRANKV